jgi:hypothetical protein
METVGRGAGAAGMILVRRFAGPGAFGGWEVEMGPRIEAQRVEFWMCVPGPGRYWSVEPRIWPGTAMGRICAIVSLLRNWCFVRIGPWR